MLCFTIVTLFLIVCNSYSSDACNGNANAFIDEVLANARPDLAPRMHLPDIHDGDLNLWDIYVWGFDSLKRGGDVCFETKAVGRETVRATFEVFNVHGSTRGSYREVFKVLGHKVGQKTWNFGVDAVIPHVKVRLGLDIDMTAHKISLIDFDFEAFDNAKFNVHLSGIWKIFNGIVSHLADHFGNKQLKPRAKTMIHDSLTKSLTKFNKFNLIPH